MRLFRKKDSEKKRKLILEKNRTLNSILFVIGCFISALSFNLFFVPYNFVSGGLGGIAIILNEVISLDSTIVLLVGNLIFIVISIITLGFKESFMSMIGASVYMLFVYSTKAIPELINFSFDNVLLYVLAAGVCTGIGESLIYKAGFNSGGTSIIALVIQKYTKQPIGKILSSIGYVIVLFGGLVFGYTAIMYSIIIIGLSTYLIDKILIGISTSKTFFINTTKVEEVEEFILETIESGVTELECKGGFSRKKGKALMCVVPTDKYSLLKTAIQEIDPNAFIVVNDCYEVLGGTERKKLLFKD